MREKIVYVVLIVGIILGMFSAVTQARVPRKGDWAIGSSISFPCLGSSVKYWFTDKWCAQLTVVPSTSIGTGSSDSKTSVSACAGKLSYKVSEGKNHYFYGAISGGNYSVSSGDYKMNVSGLSIAGGIEWLMRWFNISWLAISLEVGYGWFDPNASMNGNPVDLGKFETLNTPIVGIGFHTYLNL